MINTLSLGDIPCLMGDGPLQDGQVYCNVGDTVVDPVYVQPGGPQIGHGTDPGAPPTCMPGDTLSVVDGYWVCTPSGTPLAWTLDPKLTLLAFGGLALVMLLSSWQTRKY